MINLFRNLLLNITASDQSGSTVTEQIPSSFFPLTYSAPVEAVRRTLTGVGSVDERAYRTQFALRLTDSTELSAYLQELDNIYTFNPKNIKHFNKDFDFDVVTVDSDLQSLPDKAAFLSEARRKVNRDSFTALDYLIKYHDNPIWRVAAFIVLFLLVADTYR